MAYADQEMSSSRIVAIVIVGLIHVALGYALITGLAYSAVKEVVKTVTTVDIEEEEVEEPEPEPEDELPPPPDEPIPQVAPPPVVPPAPINIPQERPVIQNTQEIPKTNTVINPRPLPTGTPTQAAPAPPARPSQARGVEPEGRDRWARRIIENYPSAALRREIEGTVGLTVSVGGDGKVSGCRVTSSSGSDILDDAACKDISRYARFKPALNDDGDPISSSWSTNIQYKLN